MLVLTSDKPPNSGNRRSALSPEPKMHNSHVETAEKLQISYSACQATDPCRRPRVSGGSRAAALCAGDLAFGFVTFEFQK